MQRVAFPVQGSPSHWGRRRLNCLGLCLQLRRTSTSSYLLGSLRASGSVPHMQLTVMT